MQNPKLSLDLGDMPVGIPPTPAQQAQIRSAIDATSEEDWQFKYPATFRSGIAEVDRSTTSHPSLVIEMDSAPLYYRRSQNAVSHPELTVSATNIAKALQKIVIIEELGDEELTLVFPASWKWIGTMPASLAAGRIGALSLLCTSNMPSGIFAQWSA